MSLPVLLHIEFDILIVMFSAMVCWHAQHDDIE